MVFPSHSQLATRHSFPSHSQLATRHSFPSHSQLATRHFFIGIDVGTSGVRAIAIDGEAREVARADVSLPPPLREGVAVQQDPEEWWQALVGALKALLAKIPAAGVLALAIDGTSGTVFVTDAQGQPLAPALLYSDSRAREQAQRIAAIAPRESAAHGANAGLAKLLWLLERYPDAARVHTPGDWFTARLTGSNGASDANNVIKLGWDALGRQWPQWLDSLGVTRRLLPEVVDPGTPLGTLSAAMQEQFGLPAHTQVVAGTTDSTAAILATGAQTVGDAVTSLGSTLVMKVVTDNPLFAPEYGVYSQPYGTRWLVGGGSNTGGAVLRHFFDDAQLAALEPRLQPDRPTGLDYYPLLAPGERFPVSDPHLVPRLTPRPDDDAQFLQGLLEAMARIEAQSYRLLADLGAPYPLRVLSAGGGARNGAWSRMRETALGVPVAQAAHDDAAYGSALLARAAHRTV